MKKEAVINNIKGIRDKTRSKNGSRKRRSEIKLEKAQSHNKNKKDCIRLILI